MPDLVTHVAGAYLVKRGVKITRYAALFYLGAMLPDLASRPLHIIWPRTLLASQAFHSPVGVFLICWLVSLFFRVDQRKRVFFLLIAGSFLHLVMDSGQKQLEGGYLWFFPFSMKTCSLGLFWPEDSVRFLPYTAIAVLIVYGFSKWREGREKL
ncbi:MAG: metal-dependent hydrolase [Candidatus Euphemobacter frigidus]|nr:metal-dependent hydrolase [Candidatus Euphemobacter frigidus]MDP8275923.1 metal-dependent hydrolase [Candidatus Euphemobacter frigidus]